MKLYKNTTFSSHAAFYTTLSGEGDCVEEREISICKLSKHQTMIFFFQPHVKKAV